MAVFVVKWYAVREAKKGGRQYAMPKQSGTQYARRGVSSSRMSKER